MPLKLVCFSCSQDKARSTRAWDGASTRTSPCFRAALDRCETVFTKTTGESLLEIMYPNLETDEQRSIRDTHGEPRLNQTQYTQPALFCVRVGNGGSVANKRRGP